MPGSPGGSHLARRSATAPADGRCPEPLFTVMVGYETFAGRICQLANGTVVSPGSLVPWLESAWVERVRVACGHHNRRRHRRP